MKIMRTLCICLRRLRPSVFKGLCLIMSVALLMLGTSLSNLLRLHDSDGMGGTSSWPDKNHNPVQGREVLENFQTNVLYSMDAPIPSHHLNVHQRFDSSGVHWAVQKKSSDSEGANLVKVINSEKKASLWEEERPGLSQVEKNQHAVMHAPLSLEDSQAATSSLNHIFSVLHRLIFDTNLDLDTINDVRFVKELLNSTSQDTYLSGLLVNALSANTDRDLNTTLSTLLQDEKLRHILLSQNFDYSRLGNLLKTVGSLVQDGISTHIDVLYKDRGIRDKNEGKLSPSVVKKRLNPKLHRLHPKPNYNDANPRKQNPDNLSISNSDGSPIGFSSDDVSEILGMEVEVQRSANERQANILDERRDRAGRTVSFRKIVDGIYWSEEVENSIPKGISTMEADQWIARSRTLMVASLEEPDWNRCGRPKNGYAVFADGSEICARYRAPRDRMLQGEILSYWLSRLLSLDNVPPVSLSSVDSMQWITQRYRFQKMGWTSGNHVALIMWVKDMASEYGAKVFIPHFILEAYKQKHPVEGRTLDFYRNVKSDVPDNSSNSNSNMNNNNNNTTTTNNNNNNNNNNGVTRTRQTYSVVKTLVLLAQWGSMIIFDYLTGNYDRVASMQDGAETENKPSIIEESIRNLRGSRGGDKLWLIDNESGLLDAYDLLYQSPKNGPRFLAFHKQMLQTMCVFQRRVVKRLQALDRGEEGAHKMLEKYALGKEPLLGELAKDSSYDLFERHFSERLDQVINWIQHCERLAQAR